ncbi:GntR family transcriptional regulator [Dactylosporangium sp. NPDC005555]|uniref:GntR family transcriptional regulator n=1 Tax=Dactylosporangium sp. NPDC005555 TaxID=3154889 RepID=UPI0033BF350B
MLNGSVIQTVSRQTLGDRVYEQVREAIIRGEMPAGTEINQVELAARLGVSRVPVREALRRLQAERFLDANPFQRYVVTKLSPEQVLELFDLRMELEVFAALRARGRDTEKSGLAAARAAAAALDTKMSAEDWLQADMEFHRTVNGRDSAVATIIDEVRFRIYRYLHLIEPDLERRVAVLAEHEQILAALESGDDAAVRGAITTHVQHTRDRLALGEGVEATGAS